MKDSQLARPKKAIGRRAAHHVVDRFGAAAKRHLDDVGAGFFGPLVHEGDQRDRCRGVAQRAGLGLGQRRKLGERVHVERRVHHHDLGGEERIGDRREILRRVVGDLLEEELVIGERLGRQDADRIAVVRRIGAGAAADIHGAAGTVLHHDRLAPALADLIAEHAHEHVAGAAGAGRGQRPDRPRRVILRRRSRASAEHDKAPKQNAARPTPPSRRWR